MTNELSTPQIVFHTCTVHGPQISAPPSYSATCRCGKRCEIDVEGWVAVTRAHYPGEDIGELAKQAEVDVAAAPRAAAELA
jgi:hypothetical protein